MINTMMTYHVNMKSVITWLQTSEQSSVVVIVHRSLHVDDGVGRRGLLTQGYYHMNTVNDHHDDDGSRQHEERHHLAAIVRTE